MLRLLRSRRRKNGHRQGENQSRNPLGGGPECVCQTKGWKACLFGLCLRGSDSRSLKGPRVRIRFPPAVSQVRTCLSREFALSRSRSHGFPRRPSRDGSTGNICSRRVSISGCTDCGIAFLKAGWRRACCLTPVHHGSLKHMVFGRASTGRCAKIRARVRAGFCLIDGGS